MLHITFQAGLKRRGDPWKRFNIPKFGGAVASANKMNHELWRMRWAIQTSWLTDEQKVALSECLRSKVLAQDATNLDSKVVDQTLADWHAALRIQACFRGWQWRKRVLWNPNEDIG